LNTEPELEFLTFKEPKNLFQRINSVRLCSLAGQYDNPIPTWFLAPIDFLKIPAQLRSEGGSKGGRFEKTKLNFSVLKFLRIYCTGIND
jgi:hypothetical protein